MPELVDEGWRVKSINFHSDAGMECRYYSASVVGDRWYMTVTKHWYPHGVYEPIVSGHTLEIYDGRYAPTESELDMNDTAYHGLLAIIPSLDTVRIQR